MNLLNSSQFSLAVSTISSLGLGYYIYSSNSRLEEQIHILEDRLIKMDQVFKQTMNSVSNSKDENQNVIKKLADDVDSTRNTIALLKDATELMAGKMGYIVKKKSRKSKYSKNNRRGTVTKRKSRYKSDSDSSDDQRTRRRYNKKSAKKNSRQSKYSSSSEEYSTSESSLDESVSSDEASSDEQYRRSDKRSRKNRSANKSKNKSKSKKKSKEKKHTSDNELEIDDLDELANMINNMNA